MLNAVLIKTSGARKTVRPANGKKFKLQELYDLVGSPIDVQRLRKLKKIMIVNDNGKLNGLDINEEASKLWRQEYPIEEFPHNNDGTIVGNVVLADFGMI